MPDAGFPGGDFNFIVVGSGAAGLVGAITASRQGLKPVIIEKADVWGGTTAISGGVLWVPQNHLMQADNADDTAEAARKYVHALLGDNPSAREIAKADSFLESAPVMARMLAEEGVDWLRVPDHPDYYPDVEGNGIGRIMESRPFDGRRLGDRLHSMRGAELNWPAVNSSHYGRLTRARTQAGLFLDAARIVIMHKLRTLSGQRPLGNGRALVASLMQIVMAHDIPLVLSTRMVGIRTEGNSVSGIIVERGGVRHDLDAPAGVLLAAGGFANNQQLRSQLQGRDNFWSNAIPEDQGDAYLAATEIGAANDRLDDCWWMPSMRLGPDLNGLALGPRALPGSIIVDHHGRRYMNEARSYMVAGKTMLEHGADRHRHWMIMDGRLHKRYIFPELSNDALRQDMLHHGFLKQSDSIHGLAEACGLDADVLEATINRFNGFARDGRDQDFERGEAGYDLYWGDPLHKPNGSLGEIRAPFFAALVRPGDLGTNGGIRTDQQARVLNMDDQPIDGLYAAGNSSASPFGRAYPGAGSTIGAATTFGFLAATTAAARYSNQPARQMD